MEISRKKFGKSKKFEENFKKIMTEIEREFTFLITKLPENLDEFPSKIVADNYLPRGAEHPILRLRAQIFDDFDSPENLAKNDENSREKSQKKSRNKYEMTKKFPANSGDDKTRGDSSRQIENTIFLSRAEYDFLKILDGKKLIKRRFSYEIFGRNADLDIFLGDLKGFAKIEFEFDSEKEMAEFAKFQKSADFPNFIGADISQEKATAGGILAGKKFAEIAEILREKYDFKPIENVEKYEEEIL